MKNIKKTIHAVQQKHLSAAYFQSAVFFSHTKSANNTFNYLFSDKRTDKWHPGRSGPSCRTSKPGEATKPPVPINDDSLAESATLPDGK